MESRDENSIQAWNCQQAFDNEPSLQSQNPVEHTLNLANQSENNQDHANTTLFPSDLHLSPTEQLRLSQGVKNQVNTQPQTPSSFSRVKENENSLVVKCTPAGTEDRMSRMRALFESSTKTVSRDLSLHGSKKKLSLKRVCSSDFEMI